MVDLKQIREALADPSAPWYGSDLVPLVADLADAFELLDRQLQVRSQDEPPRISSADQRQFDLGIMPGVNPGLPFNAARNCESVDGLRGQETD